jgi:alpha-glucosidase
MKNSFLVTALSFISLVMTAQKYELNSPDGKLTAEIEINQGISTALIKGGNIAVTFDNVAIETGTDKQPASELKVRNINRRSVNETVEPEIRDKAETLINAFNELEIRFRGNHSITFRLFNEGLAYRLSTSIKDSLTIYRENLDLHFGEGDKAWFQSAQTFKSSYETPYEHLSVSAIEKGKLCSLPFLIEKQNGSFVMITEADLLNYPGLWLKGTGQNMLSVTNPPYPKALNYKGSLYEYGQVAEADGYIAKVIGTRHFPWRIIAIADNEKDLVANNMVYLLASPSVIDDVSWIKPGVVMFDWWGKNNIYGVDFRAGINTETARYFIDFCAEHSFRYFLFDDGWCINQDLLKPVPGLNMDEVFAYAESKGVDIMLWVLWKSLQDQWDDAFSLFKRWGVKGIKIDFMNRDDQMMVEFYEEAARQAAEQKMIVDFHGAYKPCGLSRKYPNVLTREALIEFEYNGMSGHDSPVHHNLLQYIRMFAGPMDYIPATMRNSTKDNFRIIGDYPMSQGTRAHAMAMFIVLNSPLTMLPDSPSDYYREKECTDFISRLPVVWDETRLLKGKIAEYTVMARRSGNEWFIGAITNWEKRTLELETEFLETGTYRLEAIEDGINAGTRAEDYRRKEISFRAGETLRLELASGGGYVARITPVR